MKYFLLHFLFSCYTDGNIMSFVDINMYNNQFNGC